jgi:hypothetical protein
MTVWYAGWKKTTGVLTHHKADMSGVLTSCKQTEQVSSHYKANTPGVITSYKTNRTGALPL